MKTPAEQQAAMPDLAPCPRCDRPTLVGVVVLRIGVARDGTAAPWGRPIMPPDTLVSCNSMGCDWAGTVRQVLAARKGQQ